MLFPDVFAGMFTTEADLIVFTRPALRIYMAVMLIFGIQMACQMTFNALGRAVESIVVAVMRKFILLLPLIYIMPLLFSSNKTMAVYLAEPAADLLAVTFTAILFTVRFKKALTNNGETKNTRYNKSKENIKERGKKMVHHIVMWKFKPEVEDAKKPELKKAMAENLKSLVGKVPGLLTVDFVEAPLASSTHDMALVTTLEKAEDVAVYAKHPEHVKVADTYVRPYTTERAALDYEE